MEIPEKETFKTDKKVPVAVDDEITYTCAQTGYVPDDASLDLGSICQDDGTFTDIQDWPSCR